MSGAIRVFLFGLLAFCGLLSGAGVAGMQTDPIDTVTSVISSVASQTTVVSELTDTTATATSGNAGSGGTNALSGLASGSSLRRFHSRFDRLPRRYEILLERIELGRNVHAALARLRALLASASPQLRARILRLIRLEIRRLERGGLTKRERAAAQRLGRLLTRLDAMRPTRGGPRSPGQISKVGSASGTAGGGVAGARAESQSAQAGSQRASKDERAGEDATPWGALPSPLPPSSSLDWLLLLVLLLAGTGCLLLLFSLAPRNSLPSSIRRIVAGRRRQVRTLALTVVFTGLLGLGVVVLLA